MNRKQKRSFPVLIMPVLLLMLVFGLLSGCGSSPQETKPQETKAQETKAHETGQQGAGQTKEAQQGTGQTKPGQPGTKPEQSETKPQETAEASAVGSMKDIPHYEERYYLKRLDPALEDDFLQMYRGILDFKEVNYVSSAGLRVLLSLQKKMMAVGEMKLISVNESVCDVFEVTGFDEILNYEKGE